MNGASDASSGTGRAKGCPLSREVAVPLYGKAFQDDPDAVYDDLRQGWGPVAPVLLDGEVPAWLVTGYRQLLTVVRDEHGFSHDPRRWRALAAGEVPDTWPLLPFVRYQLSSEHADGHQHRRLRSAVSDSLSKTDRTRMRRYTQRMCDDLIDTFAAIGEVDLLRRYARPLPLMVFSRLFGLSDAESPALVRSILHMVDGDEFAADASRHVRGVLHGLVTAKRESPGADLVSWLTQHPGSLSNEEILRELIVVITAGAEPTTNWIVNTLVLLTTNEEIRTAVLNGRLTIPQALDHVLWHNAPVQNFIGRYATRDTKIGEAWIQTGDMIVLGLAAANADPQVRPRPGETVENRAHVAWGGGLHVCPAQEVARLITRVAMETVLERIPDLGLAITEDALAWNPTIVSRGVTALPVTFTPTQQRADGQSGDPSIWASLAPGAQVPSPVPDAESGEPRDPHRPDQRSRGGLLARWRRGR